MLMVKEECVNTGKLLRVRLIAFINKFQRVIIFAAMILLLNLVPTIVNLLRNNAPGITPYSIFDFSLSFLVGVGLLSFILMLLYRQHSNLLSVFPQTNNSRFVSSLLFNYILVSAVGFIVLLMYLCNLAAITLISCFQDDIYLALDVDFNFIITGFFTFLMYSFLFVAFFGLVGTILRKWRYYAVTAFVLLISMTFAYQDLMLTALLKLLAFLTKESNPTLFFLKGITLLLIITALSLVLNFFTRYYMNQSKVSILIVALICAVGLAAAMFLGTADVHDESGEAQTEISTAIDDPFQTIHIDASHLPRGSSVKIKSINVSFMEYGVSYNFDPLAMKIHTADTEVLDDLQGDTIILRYLPPTYQINSINLVDFANPTLTAYLLDDTLHIEYTIERAQVVLLPIWGIAWQFDCYADREVLVPNPWMTGSGGGGGYLNIMVE